MPSHRAHRRSDRNSRDCCYKPLPSPLRTATLRARSSKARSGELCLASFSCAYVNEELSYSRPRIFAQMLDKGAWLHAEKAPDATTDPTTGEVGTRKLAQLA